MLVSGNDGVNRNAKRGVELFEKACKADDQLACFYLSGLYISGLKKKNGDSYEVQKDMAKAFEYATHSCRLGNMYSCANVSQMYAKGEGEF